MKIIKKAQSENRRKRQGTYYEKHHILPKSLFPLWKTNKRNLVLLTAREHFLCHQLLSKIYGKSMFFALWYLIHDGQNKYCIKGSKEYERIKIRITNYQSTLKQSKETIEKRCSKIRGRKNTEEQLQHLRDAQKRLKDSGVKTWAAAIEKTRKEVKCIENGIIYSSVNEAARELHLSQGNISGVIAGHRKQTKGYHFIFV